MLCPDQVAQCGEDFLAFPGGTLDAEFLLGQQKVGATAQSVRMIAPEHSLTPVDNLFLQVPGLGQVALTGEDGGQHHPCGKRVRVIVTEPVSQPGCGGLGLGSRADVILIEAQGGGDVQPADE